jgi:hypothetical protein
VSLSAVKRRKAKRSPVVGETRFGGRQIAGEVKPTETENRSLQSAPLGSRVEPIAAVAHRVFEVDGQGSTEQVI